MLNKLNDDIVNMIIDMRTDELEEDIKKLELKIYTNKIIVSAIYNRDITPLANALYLMLENLNQDAFDIAQIFSIFDFFFKDLNECVYNKYVNNLIGATLNVGYVYKYVYIDSLQALYKIYEDDDDNVYIIENNILIDIEDL